MEERLTKPWSDKERLREVYARTGSTPKAAEEMGCSDETIRRWLHKFDLEVNDPPDDWSGKNNPKYNGGDITLVCKNCQEDYKVGRRKKNTSSFCSIPCKAKWQESHMRGEDNPFWKGGEDSRIYYGKDWPTIREEVIQRDDEMCVMCDEERKVHIEETGRDLTVHHITPAREYLDSSGKLDPEANRKSNLMTVCSSCHIRAERDK